MEGVSSVPVVDVFGEHTAATSALDAALRMFGFFYVPCPFTQLVEAQFGVSKALFALPTDVKRSFEFDERTDTGYQAAGEQTLNPDGTAQRTGDTKEVFTNNAVFAGGTYCAGREDPFEGSHNAFPPVEGLRTVNAKYLAAASELNELLIGLLFDALSVSDEAERKRLSARPFTVLKQMRYEGEVSDPAAGKFGAGAHADWGSFTLLATDATPGLQVLVNGEWVDVPPKPGHLIINAGDQIAALTNGAYRSAVHRVLTTSTTPRYSTAVFAYFSWGARVSPLPSFAPPPGEPPLFPPRTTEEYFRFKLGESVRVGGYA